MEEAPSYAYILNLYILVPSGKVSHVPEVKGLKFVSKGYQS